MPDTLKERSDYWVVCPECFRSFNLNDEQDAAEWSTGHDCETEDA